MTSRLACARRFSIDAGLFAEWGGF